MSELGVSRRDARLLKFKEFRKELWLQFMAGATIKQLKEKYHYKYSSGISNLLTRAEKEQNAQTTNQ